jgi:hypothetical protein
MRNPRALAYVADLRRALEQTDPRRRRDGMTAAKAQLFDVVLQRHMANFSNPSVSRLARYALAVQKAVESEH